MISFWRSLGRTEAINWIAVAVVVVLQVNGVNHVNSGFEIVGREPLFYASIFLAFVPMLAVLGMARFVVIPHVPVWLRPYLTLVSFEIAIFVRTWTFDALIRHFSFSVDSQFGARLASAQINQMIVFVVFAYLVSSANDFARQNKELAQSLEALNAAQRDTQQRLAERKRSLILSIQNQLRNALAGLRGFDSEKDAEGLKSVIDDIVRPISHQLGREFEADVPGRFDTDRARIQLRTLFVRSVTDNPFHPLLFTLWVFPAAVTTLVSWVGQDSLWLGALLCAIYYVVALALHWAWKLVPAAWGVVVRAVLITLAPMLFGFIANQFVHVFIGPNTPDNSVTLSIFFMFITWSITLVVTSRRLLRENFAALTEANAALRRQLVTENAEARHFEEAVSRVLHGPVQDAVAASLLRVQQLPPGTKLGSSELEQIRRPVEQALTLLNAPEISARSVEQSLLDLTELWNGVVSITLQLDQRAVDAIALSEGSNSTVVELLREAISNAIRHGDASQVVVEVALVNDKDALLRVSNNGEPVTAEGVPGIGTKLLNDLAVSWSRQNVDGEVVVEAVVPLETNQSRAEVG